MKKSHSNNSHISKGIAYTGVDVHDADEDLAFAEAVTVEMSAAANINGKHDESDYDRQNIHGNDKDETVFMVDSNAVTVLKNETGLAHGATSTGRVVTMGSVNIASGSDLEEATPVPGHQILVKGELQPSEYRDAWATVLFLIQCVVMVGVAIAYFPYIGQAAKMVSANTTTTAATTAATTATATSELSDDLTNNTDADDKSGLDFLYILLISYAIAGVTTMLTLSLMMRYSESLVKMSFFFAPLIFIAIFIIRLLAGDAMAVMDAIFALVFSIIIICHWAFYKKHVAFAAANLRSALTALKLNSATFGVAFLFSVISFVALIVSAIAFVGVQSKAGLQGVVSCAVLHKDDDSVVYQPGQMCDTNPPNAVLTVALMFCFYWTQQVIKNVVHVTTAGVVGSWWFAPMGDPSSSTCCCSTSHPSVTASSLSRAMTYSFGSICFGSLLVSIAEVLKSSTNSSNRNGRDCSILGCILQVGLCVHPVCSWNALRFV